MAYVHPAWVEHERKRWMRPDAERFIRHDAHRFMAPGAPRYVGKDVVRYFWPEHQTQSTPARGTEVAQAGDDDYLQKLAALKADLPRLRREVAAIEAELKFQRFFRALKERALKAGFNPNQPRVPAGNPDGGQWTGEGEDSTAQRPAAYRLAASSGQSASYCWNQMQIDMLYCASLIPPRVVAACRAQAMERYAACLAGKPLPPLPF